MDYNKLLSESAVKMRPSGIRKFFDLAAEMPECISLGVGEPDFQTPWDIRDAAIHSLEIGRTKYTANSGLKELREAICEYMKRKFDLSYELNQTIVTVGGSEAIDLAIRALVEPGDEVIIPEPCYVSYEPITTLTGGTPVHIACLEENDFRITAEQIKAALSPKTKILVLGFPNNPTGAVLRHEDLIEIAEVLKDTDVTILSDEIYAELVYGMKYESIAAVEGMKERTVVVGGFSKTFSMTGWRLGFACGPEPLIDVDEMRKQYDMRRQYCVRKLNEMGLKTFEPRGAFYVFPNITSSGMSSEDFCQKLLQEKHVAIVPGTAFGDAGEGFARISYAYSIDHLREAFRRIAEFLEDHKGEN